MAKFGWCMDALQWGSERLHGECRKTSELGDFCDCPCHKDDPVVIAAREAREAERAPVPRTRKKKAAPTSEDLDAEHADEDEAPDEENDE